MLSNLFKSITKISLTEALELKEKIQNRLKVCQNILFNENVVKKRQKRNYNLKKIIKESLTLQENLITLKLLIQIANLTTPEGEKECISYNVYLLSEKKNLIQNYEAMQKKTIEGNATNSETTGVENEPPVFTYAVLAGWLSQLKNECITLESNLTRLNAAVSVSIPFKPTV